MTNHVHLLVQVSDVPLGRLMLRIAGQYARTIQRGLRTTGHLFEKRYHAVLVDADSYMLELLRYIHLNPVRARIVGSVDRYLWSSHHAYLGTQRQQWVTTDFALSMFHARRRQAIAAYRRFVGASTKGVSPLLECNPNDRRILGSDDFACRILGAAWRPRSLKSLDELMLEAAHEFRTSVRALRSRSRQRDLALARAWFARQAITQRVASLSQVARVLQRDESSVRESLRRHFPE